MDATAFSYAALPHAGAKRGLTYHAGRRAFWFADPDHDAVVRYAYDGAAWVASSRTVTGVMDLGVAPDGSVVVVTTTGGTLRLLDPDTLADVGVFPNGGAFYSWDVSAGIPVTNDGRAWVGATWTYGELRFFDLATRAYGVPDPPVTGSWTSGPWFSVSRDGEHLVIVTSTAYSPLPPMRHLEATVGTVQVIPGEPKFFYQASQSDDGSRMLLDNRLLRDASFATLGTITLPAASQHFARGGVLSPDGTRAYLLVAPYAPEFPGASPPRLLVYDASAPATGTSLPLLETIELPDDVTCRKSECYGRAHTVVMPDGGTIILAGSERILIVPVTAP